MKTRIVNIALLFLFTLQLSSLPTAWSVSSISSLHGNQQWYLDECDSDPNIAIGHNDSCSASHALLIAVTKLHGNPYHAFHDGGWAVAHYLRHCLPNPANTPRIATYLYLNISEHRNFTFCTKSAGYLNKTEQPSWGACVLRAAAGATGIPLTNIITGDTLPSDRSPQCFRRTVNLRSTFRHLRYKTRRRDSSTGMPRGPQRLLRIEAVQKALRFMAEGMFITHSLRSRGIRPDGRVRVLLYDRQDVRRRQWQNPEPVIDLLRADERVHERRISFMPLGTVDQAKIFRWADVVISPHGAGLANTVFLRPGADIVEVWKCCRESVSRTPELPRNWTGWHADVMQLGLRYVQCHPMDHPYYSAEELEKEEHVAAEDQWCKLKEFRVDPEDLKKALNVVIPRQIERVGIIRRRELTATGLVYLVVLLAGLVVVRCMMSKNGLLSLLPK